MTDDLRALDRKVAEKVMGWRVERRTGPFGEYFVQIDARGDERPFAGPDLTADDAWLAVPPFSADTDAGWASMKLVAEAVWQKLQLPFHLDYLLVHFKGEPDWRMGWQARFGMDIHASAFGAPEATCRAALACFEKSD